MNSSKTRFSTAKIVAICCLFALCIASILGAVLPNDGAEAKFGDVNPNLIYLYDYSSWRYNYDLRGASTTYYLPEFALYNDTGEPVYFLASASTGPGGESTIYKPGDAEHHDVVISPGATKVFPSGNGNYSIGFGGFSSYDLPISKLAPKLLYGYNMDAATGPVKFVNDTGKEVYVKYVEENGKYAFRFYETQVDGSIPVGTETTEGSYNYAGGHSFYNEDSSSGKGMFYYDYKRPGDNRVWTGGHVRNSVIDIVSNPFYDVPSEGSLKYYNKATGEEAPLRSFEWSYDESTDTISVNCDDAPTESSYFSANYVSFVQFLAKYKGTNTKFNFNISERSEQIPSCIMPYLAVEDKTTSSGVSVGIRDYVTDSSATPLRRASTLEAIVSNYEEEINKKLFISWSNSVTYDQITSDYDSRGTQDLLHGIEPRNTPDYNKSLMPIAAGGLSTMAYWAYTRLNAESVTVKVYEFDTATQKLSLLATSTQAVNATINLKNNVTNLSASVVAGEKYTFESILARAGVPRVSSSPMGSTVHGYGIQQVGNSDYEFTLTPYTQIWQNVGEREFNYLTVANNPDADDNAVLNLKFNFVLNYSSMSDSVYGSHYTNIGTSGADINEPLYPPVEGNISLYVIEIPEVVTTCHSITISNPDSRFDYYVGGIKGTPVNNETPLVFDHLDGGVEYGLRMVLHDSNSRANYSFFATTEHDLAETPIDCADTAHGGDGDPLCHFYPCEAQGCGFQQKEYHVYDETLTCECGASKPCYLIDASFDGTVTDVTATGAQAKLGDDEDVRTSAIAQNSKITVYYYLTRNPGDIWETTVFPTYDDEYFEIEAITGSTKWGISCDIPEMKSQLEDGIFAGFVAYSVSVANGEDGTGYMFSITYNVKKPVEKLGKYEFGVVAGSTKAGIGWNDETGTCVRTVDYIENLMGVALYLKAEVTPAVYFYYGSDSPVASTGTLEGNTSFVYDEAKLTRTTSKTASTSHDISFVLGTSVSDAVLTEVSTKAKARFYKYDSSNTADHFKGELVLSDTYYANQSNISDAEKENFASTPKNAGSYVIEYTLTDSDTVCDFAIYDFVSIGKGKLKQAVLYKIFKLDADAKETNGSFVTNGYNYHYAPANNILSEAGTVTYGEYSFINYETLSMNNGFDVELEQFSSMFDVKLLWYRFTPTATGASLCSDNKTAIFLYGTPYAFGGNGAGKHADANLALDSTPIVVEPDTDNEKYFFYLPGLYKLVLTLKDEYKDNYEFDAEDNTIQFGTTTKPWYHSSANPLNNGKTTAPTTTDGGKTGAEMFANGELDFYFGISKARLYGTGSGTVTYNGDSQFDNAAVDIYGELMKTTTYGANYSDKHVWLAFGDKVDELLNVEGDVDGGYIDVGSYNVNVSVKQNEDDSDIYNDYARYFAISNSNGFPIHGSQQLTFTIEPKTVYVTTEDKAEQDYSGSKNENGEKGIAAALAGLQFTDESGETVLTESPLYLRDGIVTTGITTGGAYATNESTTEITYAAENAGTYVLKADFTVNTEAEGYVAGSKGLANYNFVFSSEYVINKIESPSVFYTTDKPYDGTTFVQGDGYASSAVTNGQYWVDPLGNGATANDGTVKYYFIVDDVWTEITWMMVYDVMSCNMEYVDAGTYTLGAKITGATNYEDWQDTKTVSITRKRITWTYMYGSPSGVSLGCYLTANGLVGSDNISSLFSSNKPLTSYSKYLSGGSDDQASYIFSSDILSEDAIPVSKFTFADADVNPNYTVDALEFRKVVKIIFEDHTEDHVLSTIPTGASWLTKAETKNCGTTTDCTVTYQYRYVFVDESNNVTFSFYYFSKLASDMATALPLDRYTFAGWSYNGTPIANETAVFIAGSSEVNVYTFRTIWTCQGVYVTYMYKYAHLDDATYFDLTGRNADENGYLQYMIPVEGSTPTEYRSLQVGDSVELELSFANANWNNWFVSDGWKDKDGNVITVAPAKDITLYAIFDFDASKIGDVNGNGALDSTNDVVFMRRNVVNYTLNEVVANDYDSIASLFYNATESYADITDDYTRLFFTARADANADGSITLADIVILRMALTNGYDYEELESEGRVIETVEADTVEELQAGLNAGKKVILTADITDTEVAINITNATFAMIDLGTHKLTLAGLTLCGGNTNTYVAIIGSTGASITLNEGATFKCEAPRGTATVTGVVVTCGTTQVFPVQSGD